MKCTIPEISWHNREPVLSVDIHPVSNDFYKLASGGGDSHILIWQMVLCENGSVKQEVISDLTRHQKSVNTVRWSSSGQYLASADDDANIIVWQLKNDNIPLLEGDTEDKEVWIVYKILRGHKEDIYDLCWSIDNMKLLSGSIDNTAILWDLTKGKMDHIMSDHKGFVQGVAWDPKNQLLATISTDRICRVFDVTGKHVKTRIHKGKLPVSSDHFLHDKESKFFHDDTFKSFFRRLQFTPDGSLLVVPSGHFQVDECKIINSTLVFTLDNWIEPAAVLPLDRQSSTVVRCCPLLFHQREDGPEPLVKLPYRMIFAVGTDHDIILYDTQQIKPFARFHEIHYTRITDITWSSDGLLLIASSTDGFCSLITFEPEELGKIYVKEVNIEEVNKEDINQGIENADKDENIDITNKNLKEDIKKEEVKKKSSFIKQWAQNTPPPKRPKLEITDTGDNKEVIEIGDSDDGEPKELSKQIKEEINKLLPRRPTPKIVDGTIKNTNSIAKPIEVRRKPREVDNSKDDKNNTVASKPINTLIPRRITPKKVGEASAAKFTSFAANPISFTKKVDQDIQIDKVNESRNKDEPVVTSNQSNSVKKAEKSKFAIKLFDNDSKVNKINVDNDSKKIEINDTKKNSLDDEIIVLDEDSEDVPIKTKESEEENTKNDNKNESLTIVKIKNSGISNNKKSGKEQPAKLVSKDKCKNNTTISAITNNAVTNKEDDSNITKIKNLKIELVPIESNKKNEKSKKTPKKSLLFTKGNNVSTPPKKQTSSDQNSSATKKNEIPKIKVNSLIHKKVNTTPAKTNPLLNFLRKSEEKKKQKPKISEQQIDLTLDEDEARDGFDKVASKVVDEIPDAVPLEEDCTEDFCLQLEETQDDKKPGKIVNEEKMEVDEITEENKQVHRTIEISDESSSPKEKKEENTLQKKPRRVPLITLASPTGKKKPAIEKNQHN